MQLAGCIIKNKDGKILLIHRKTPKRVQWEIPGGKVDPGESPMQTAIREIKEELGVVVDVVRHIGSRIFEQDGDEHEYHWFEAVVSQGAPQVVEIETFDDLQHFGIDDMHDMNDALSANTKNFVAAARNQEITP